MAFHADKFVTGPIRGLSPALRNTWRASGGATTTLEPGHVVEGRPAGVGGGGRELTLDPHQAVVLGRPFTPGRGAGLNLAGIEGNHQIGDARILGLARTV